MTNSLSRLTVDLNIFHSRMSTESEFLKHLGKHYLAIICSYADTNSSYEGCLAYSCCLVKKGGVFFVLTAGHAINELHTHLREGKIRITGRYLVDIYGGEVKSSKPIPFDPLSVPARIIDKDGLDYALLQVPANTQELLKANGLDPYPLKVSDRPPDSDFFKYIVVGFPAEKVECNILPQMEEICVVTQPYGIGLARQADDQSTGKPRFHGKVSGPVPLMSPKGMSGGPIFGLVRKDEKLVDVYLVAVQHSKKEGNYDDIFGSLIDEIWCDVASSAIRGGENTISADVLMICNGATNAAEVTPPTASDSSDGNKGLSE